MKRKTLLAAVLGATLPGCALGSGAGFRYNEVISRAPHAVVSPSYAYPRPSWVSSPLVEEIGNFPLHFGQSVESPRKAASFPITTVSDVALTTVPP